MSISHKHGKLLSGVSHFGGIVAGGVSGINGQNILDTHVQNFESYTNGASLATMPYWTVFAPGVWQVGAGTVYPNYAGYTAAMYDNPGFVTTNDHEAEITLARPVGNSQYTGPAVAMQPGAEGYTIFTEQAQSLYMCRVSSGTFHEYVFFSMPVYSTELKMRIKVTGTGAGRRLTGAYNSGAGWVIPPGFDSVFLGYGYDGGKAGVWGLGAVRHTEIKDLTIRSLAPA